MGVGGLRPELDGSYTSENSIGSEESSCSVPRIYTTDGRCMRAHANLSFRNASHSELG